MTLVESVHSREAWSRVRHRVTDSVVLGAAAALVGLVLHVVLVAMREFGLEWGAILLRGNGAAVILPLAFATFVIGEVICVRRRAWLGMALVPIGLFAGLFVVLGGV